MHRSFSKKISSHLRTAKASIRLLSPSGYLVSLLAIIYVSSFLVNLYSAYGKPIVTDEDLHVAAGMMYLARLPFMYMGSTALPFHYWHPAFAKLLMGAFVKGLSFLDFSSLCQTGCATPFATFDEVMKARIGAVAVSSLAPVLLFLLLRDVTRSNLAGLVGAEFLATDTAHVWWSRAWLDPFAATFMVGALFFFYRAQKSMGREYYVLAGVFTGLSVASKYFGVLTVGVILLMYLPKVVNIRHLELRRELVGLGLLVAAAAVAFYLADVTIWGRPDVFLASIQNPQGTGAGFGFDIRTPVFIGSDSIGEAWGISQTRLIPLVGFIIGLPYALYLLIKTRGSERSGVVLLLAYFLVTVGFLTLELRKSPYYYLIAVPSVVALASVGLYGLSRSIAAVANRFNLANVNASIILGAFLILHFLTLAIMYGPRLGLP